MVGYWHTHPQVIPQISSTDILSFARFAQRYAQELPYPIAVIVGTSPSPEDVKAWSIRAGTCIEALRINGAD
nr:Mov34/MPN/PAD-1 family protein [Photorhabdus khanii]